MRNWAALLIAIIGAIVLAIIATTPPAPAPSSAPKTVFSAARAMADIRVIARAPHPTGSAENARVSQYLVVALQTLGLQAEIVPGTMSDKAHKQLDAWRGSPAATPPLMNVVATLPGRDRSKPAVLLMAHHDSVWGSPGAADDSAGVASILEVVRAIVSQGRPERDLIVLLTDGEEIGLEGAKAFFASDPRRGHVGVIVNLETRGGGGRAQMFETGPGNGAMMDLFAASVAQPTSTSLSVFIYNTLPNSTDYTVAKKLGVPGFNFAFIGRPGLYHSPLATPDAVDQGAVQDMGRQALDLTRGLLAAPVLPGKTADLTFFDAFGLFFVSYPAWAGWLILAVGALGYAAAAWRRATIAELAKGAGILFGLILFSAALLFIVNFISGGVGKNNYYDRLAAIPRLEVQALLVCLASLVLFRRWLPSRIGTIAGAAGLVIILGSVTQALAPTASYPFAVPLMLGGAALALDRFAGRRAGLIATIVAAMLGVGYMLGFGFFLLQAVAPRTPMIAAIPLAIGTMLLLPLLPAIRDRRGLIVATVLLALAVGVALWVLLDPIAPSVAVYSTDH